MGYKVFVSYKYRDDNVKTMPNVQQPTWPCDYVQYLQDYVFKYIGCIYKGETQGDDLSYMTDDQIWEHLKPKIYDSSITIVLISPNMKEPYKWERTQWIPWEIAYSLRETTRSDRTSHSNAIIAVKLPDKNGYYYYFDKNRTFSILKDNIDNGYIDVVNWEDFIAKPEEYLLVAQIRKQATPSYKLVKTV